MFGYYEDEWGPPPPWSYPVHGPPLPWVGLTFIQITTVSTAMSRVERFIKSEDRAGGNDAGSSISTQSIRPGDLDNNTLDAYFDFTLKGTGLLPMAAPWSAPLPWWTTATPTLL